jgi:hypothetical protein
MQMYGYSGSIQCTINFTYQINGPTTVYVRTKCGMNSKVKIQLLFEFELKFLMENYVNVYMQLGVWRFTQSELE